MNHRLLFLIVLILTTSVGCNKKSSNSPAGGKIQGSFPDQSEKGRAPLDEVRNIVAQFFSDTALTREFVDSCLRVVSHEDNVTVSWEFKLTQKNDNTWYLWDKPLGRVAGIENPTVGDVLNCGDNAVIFTLEERRITLSNTVGFCLESELVDSDTGEKFKMNVTPADETPLTSGIVVAGWAVTKSKNEWLSEFGDSSP